MPIRMVDDDPNEERQDNNSNDNNSGGGGGDNSGGGSGGGGGFGQIMLIGALLSWLFRYPKLALFLLALAGLFYFFRGCGSSSTSGGGGGTSSSRLNTGMQLDEKRFDKALVFEPLAAGSTTLPPAVSLEQFCPPRGNQGQQGSCVGWSSTYAARTILEAAASGGNPADLRFSPAFTYNQIHLANCNGSYMDDALKLLCQRGGLPLSQFAYSDQTCDKKPNAQEAQAAAANKMRGYNRLTLDGDNYTVDMQAMKQNLAQGAPVVIGAMVSESFQYLKRGQSTWQPVAGDPILGGHALCVMGYDDNHAGGGAFQIMNSWGESWGDGGIGWVRYADFPKFCKEAYGLFPLAKKGAAAEGELKAAIGLVDWKTKQYIPLKSASSANGSILTSAPVTKNSKFKIEIQNSTECYVYVFGQDTDNSSYVLFPYTEKHSPYCGITGTRVFPKGQSMSPDDVGSKDLMAIVVSKKELDFKTINEAANKSSQSNYFRKLEDALGSRAAKNTALSTDGKRFSFDVKDPTHDAIVVGIEINK